MSEKNTPLVIGGVEIAPGETRSVDIPLAAMYTHTDVGLTVHIIHGKRPGPCLLVTAAVHGDEINGVDIIRRVLGIKELSKLRGTLMAIPVVNVHGFLNQSRYLPDGRDLNRCFPGSQQGSLAGRVAHTLVNEILQHCTHCIDLHTGARHRANLPQIRVDLSQQENQELALAFGSPVVLDAKLRDGSLRMAASERGIPLLLYEAGEALRFDEFSIRAGTRGIINVMRQLNMLPRKSRLTKDSNVTIADDSRWVRAPISGVMRPLVQLGAKVKKRTVLAYISDPIGMNQIAVYSPAEAIVIGLTNLPLIHEGEALFHLANYHKQIHQVADQVVNFHETFDPGQDDDEPFFIGEDDSLLN
ncbi:succinylglutamate desuccinylase/aspartoacylase family protein [Gilvimarinus sp. SDUM040013]|uniref:Succinylglutamate desuccinylase/aspartoacylase family protein n=1 Tax=Gilvimarinus gilvus TaxID=3058038 RepID=A0ABU4RWK7_9GAMM|nr:succinylglutamate desuccinylase/aspartoacylase family protein [Gilvimarinus sp. SDUM040013]MDO3385270.1 succinylglutamate desuccinylase/aspartoacylase family protein [Gilvimarinus sp. SDUM040013]MDX6849253.1 succinylglutamate desuccinylase/aspartoacylase family protein [Gilvimarinus sp. SDUM040013]